MVLLLVLVQEVWLGGVTYHTSSRSVLLVAGVLSFLSAGLGAVVAVVLSGRLAPAPIVMSVMVAAETSLLLATGRFPGPLWFDLLASASLVVGIGAGALVFRRFALPRSGG